VAAERALVGGGVRRRDRRQVVDQVAASVFLQTWLDRRAGKAGRP
jgi:RNase H-fold protein (predicted Holliday junction resolvase)